MAVYDEDRPKRTDRLNDRVRDRVGGSGTMMAVVALVVVAILGFWIFSNRTTDGGGVTRTSPPVTTAPNTTAPNTPAPTTTPKQP